jgi:amino-acid N-acetyltransferase
VSLAVRFERRSGVEPARVAGFLFVGRGSLAWDSCRGEASAVLRQARVTDVPAIHALISHFAEQGRMLARSRSRLYETLRDFLVEEDEGQIVGAGSLRIMWEDLGEICSLAVADSHQKSGIGSKIVESLLSQAVVFGVGRVMVLTYIPKFFKRFGFRGIAKNRLPHKVWTECVSCPKFPDCGEQALIKMLG